jgi:hypothetical protein
VSVQIKFYDVYNEYVLDTQIENFTEDCIEKFILTQTLNYDGTNYTDEVVKLKVKFNYITSDIIHIDVDCDNIDSGFNRYFVVAKD